MDSGAVNRATAVQLVIGVLRAQHGANAASLRVTRSVGPATVTLVLKADQQVPVPSAHTRIMDLTAFGATVPSKGHATQESTATGRAVVRAGIQVQRVPICALGANKWCAVDTARAMQVVEFVRVTPTSL